MTKIARSITNKSRNQFSVSVCNECTFSLAYIVNSEVIKPLIVIGVVNEIIVGIIKEHNYGSLSIELNHIKSGNTYL